MLGDFKTPFIWFTGVVEDINDPRECGRVRVRCFGYHTENKTQIPTGALPWATVMMPVTSASISGAGQSPTGIRQGSWVIGFFRDGPTAQDPVVMGTVPSYSSPVDSSKGFADPDGVYPTRQGNDTPDASRGDSEQSVARKSAAGKASQINIPDISAPKYPENHTTVTPEGHAFELDDTDGASRVALTHKNGNYKEFQEDGSAVEVIQKNNYRLIVGDDFVEVQGSVNLFVNGNTSVNVTGNAAIDAGGNVEITAGGNADVTASQASITATTLIDISAPIVNITGATAVNIGGGAVNLG